jgi:hypothetical protein
MRYYEIKIGGKTKYTSHPNGQFDPGALRVELHIPIIASEINVLAFIRIWGISWKDMIDAKNLNTQTIEVWGGMKKGLPLANPAQAGKLCSGIIAQAFGNWEGVNKTLDISLTNDAGNTGTATVNDINFDNKDGTIETIPGDKRSMIVRSLLTNTKSSLLARNRNFTIPSIGQTDIISDIASGLNSLFKVGQNQVNIVLIWTSGQKLSDALQQCLKTAFPKTTITIDISDKLVQNHDEKGFYQTIGQLATYIRQVSTFIMQGSTKNYTGVSISFANGKITVTDSEASSKSFTQSAYTINYTDLVGLPIWIAAQQIQVKTVLRADIQFDQVITIAPTPTLAAFVNGGVAFDNPSDLDNRGKMVFSGNGKIMAIDHYGDSRSASGDAWVSVYTVYVGNEANPVNLTDQSGG